MWWGKTFTRDEDVDDRFMNPWTGVNTACCSGGVCGLHKLPCASSAFRQLTQLNPDMFWFLKALFIAKSSKEG